MVIHLSHEPEDVLVVHSKVLAAASQRLRSRFSKDWQKAKVATTVTTNAGTNLPIYTYRLLYDDAAFTISDEVSPGRDYESSLRNADMATGQIDGVAHRGNVSRRPGYHFDRTDLHKYFLPLEPCQRGPHVE